MDTLVDEFDPIRSLDAFGMHVIEDNPGVKEALSAREHSIAIQLNSVHKGDADDAAAAGQSGDTAQTSADRAIAGIAAERSIRNGEDGPEGRRCRQQLAVQLG